VKDLLSERIEEIESYVNVMEMYLDQKWNMGDLHGVADAAMDLREAKAKLEELHWCRELVEHAHRTTAGAN
jgi:hypothetical protein